MAVGPTGLIGSSATTPTPSPGSPHLLPRLMTHANVAPGTVPGPALPTVAWIAGEPVWKCPTAPNTASGPCGRIGVLAPRPATSG